MTHTKMLDANANPATEPPLPTEQLRRRALEHTPGGVLSFDDDGRIVLASPALHRLMDAPPRSLIGRSFNHLLAPGSRVFYTTHFFPMLKLKGSVDEVHLQLHKASGENLDMLVSASREIEHGHALTHCVLIPMAQRKQLEAELVEFRRVAEAATAAKDQFLAVVSHELRSPLSAILGWARIGQSAKVDTAMRLQAFQTIERNAIAQARLIDDLLDVSRIVSGKMRLSPRSIDLAPIIELALDNVRPAAQARNITILSAVDRLPHVVLADPDRIQQIAWNLLTNAIKFTPRDGSIRVTLARVNSQLVFSVADSGAGISPAQLPFVFERFWQSDGTTGQKSGLGLGLSICRSLVELHGGTIRADSRGLGHGTTFSVGIPLAAAVASAPGRLGPPSDLLDEQPLATSLQNIRVLVVDDDTETRHLMRVLLESAGATVSVAASYESAIAALQHEIPDVLLSDIGLQGKDGYELIRDVRLEQIPGARSMPAVAITGLARPQDRIAILRAGFQAYLVKPIEPAELMALIRALVRDT